MKCKFWVIAPGLLILAGCTFPVRQRVDNLICDRSTSGFDVDLAKEEGPEKNGKKEKKKEEEEPKKPQDLFLKRARVPDDIPGSNAPDLKLPGKGLYKVEIEKVIKEHFPPISKVKKEDDPDFPPGPDGEPLTLSDLQHIAFTKSPLLRQAASDIEAARGVAIQVAAYPNPTIGYQSVGAGTGGGPFAGMFLSQTIKTAGKLKLAQAAALTDLRAAELAYRRAETDLMSSVRTNYYLVLVAQESVRANRGLVELTDEMYRIMVDQLRGGQAAVYEPKQLKVFSDQARVALIQARNSRLLAWRQLAAALGVPHMPPTALAGRVNYPVPKIDFEKALTHVLTKHTDVLTTAETIEKARHNLRLAQVTPIPDVTVQATVLNDLTPPGPSRLNPTVSVGGPLPVFDLNKGAIRQAQAALVRAMEEPHRVQADLTSRFSEAYRRYDENRIVLEVYHKSTLPSQVQAFRAAVRRYFAGDPAQPGALAFSDVVAAEQNLVTIIGNYLPVLAAQWQAVVDVSSFLQTDQLYQMADEVSNVSLIDLEELLKLPCHHPCSPEVLAPTPDSFRFVPATPPISQAPAVLPGTLLPILPASMNAPGPALRPLLPTRNAPARDVPSTPPVSTNPPTPAFLPILPPRNAPAPVPAVGPQLPTSTSPPAPDMLPLLPARNAPASGSLPYGRGSELVSANAPAPAALPQLESSAGPQRDTGRNVFAPFSRTPEER
jgi:cobalt-zinc-cadmium efflux system outer membrane protein